MGHASQSLAALIGSRICHDLISPIGAIHNGLELLDMAGSTDGPEIGLIADSVGNAEARIRFFRLAYGAASDHTVSRSEVVSVLEDVFTGGRLTLDWIPIEPQPRSDIRLALLALQCCETAMPYGGRIQVDVDPDGWIVSGSADRLTVDRDLWASLTEPGQTVRITPALVQFALLPVAVSERGRTLTVAISANRVTMRF